MTATRGAPGGGAAPPPGSVRASAMGAGAAGLRGARAEEIGAEQARLPAPRLPLIEPHHRDQQQDVMMPARACHTLAGIGSLPAA